MSRPSVVIVSPALAAANNGNWQTAQRWRDMLDTSCNARIVQAWPDAESAADTVMLALHARRSAASIQAWAGRHGSRGLAVVLTGTDLYQDIDTDAQALQSLQLAQRLVVLQELGAAALPQAARHKAAVIFQSTETLPAASKSGDIVRAVMVGHMRGVKSPQTVFEAARRLADDADIQIEQIGEALEPGMADEARATESACPNYHWLGPLPHAQAREHIRRAHVLINSSAMEGGAHVVMEAVCSGTAVLASRIPGNVGMLGVDYEGYFPHGDASALAGLLRCCRQGQSSGVQGPSGALLERLGAQCALRAPLFAPAAERAALLRLLDDLLDHRP